MKVPTIYHVCRVCGLSFTASRFDAITCSSTCRQRLRRGHALAYLAGLPKRKQRREREAHAAFDRYLVAYREDVAAKHRVRELNREHRRQKREQERERIVAEFVGRAQIKVMKQEEARRHQRMLGGVAAMLKVFAQEQRNDISAQAIADAIASPEHYPVDVVSELLDELRASGDYDNIISESASPHR